MPELSDTELIATRLLGWVPYLPKPLEFDDDVRALYRKDGELVALFDLDPPCLRAVAIDGSSNVDWPDLTNWNSIRRMEDALAEKGLLGKYVECLEDIVPIQPDYDQHLGWRCWKVMTSTAAQRVAACVKVLREIERAEIDGRAK